jgi:hypothetical protein
MTCSLALEGRQPTDIQKLDFFAAVDGQLEKDRMLIKRILASV